MKTRLSLIIPTYNCAEFIDETLGSVLCQLPDDCELIAVDDGSSDASSAAETVRQLKELAESEKSEAGDEFLEVYTNL